MKKNIYIITGTSRGLGEALAQKLIAAENHLYCISRNHNPRLKVEAQYKEGELEDISFDLNNIDKIPEMMNNLMHQINPEEISQIVLINNAGTIHPIKPIGQNTNKHPYHNIVHVNLLAPMLITEIFVRETQDWKVEKKVVNLSTGAAKNPVPSWAGYCSTKAGLDMFTRVLQVEQADKAHPVKCTAFAPGIVDTEMQSEIRQVPEQDFAEVDRFKGYKDKGELMDPYQVAKKLIELINSDEFGDEVMTTVRTL